MIQSLRNVTSKQYTQETSKTLKSQKK